MITSSPSEAPILVDVDEEALIVLRLENPGNRVDSYDLSHSVLLDQNISEDPGVIVSFSRDLVSLSAGESDHCPHYCYSS